MRPCPKRKKPPPPQKEEDETFPLLLPPPTEREPCSEPYPFHFQPPLLLLLLFFLPLFRPETPSGVRISPKIVQPSVENLRKMSQNPRHFAERVASPYCSSTVQRVGDGVCAVIMMCMTPPPPQWRRRRRRREKIQRTFRMRREMGRRGKTLLENVGSALSP